MPHQNDISGAMEEYYICSTSLRGWENDPYFLGGLGLVKFPGFGRLCLLKPS